MEQKADKDPNHGSSSSDDLPMPHHGVSVTFLLISRDVERSRNFYTNVLGAMPLPKGPPGILRFHNTWLILSSEGDPTEDKPGVVARAPQDETTLTSALNLRVPDIHEVYEQWRARGAEFLTPPKEHASEIRCYLRDPDGRLIEVGQTKTMARAT